MSTIKKYSSNKNTKHSIIDLKTTKTKKYNMIKLLITNYNKELNPTSELQESLINKIHNNVEYCNTIFKAKHLDEYYDNKIKLFKMNKNNKKVKFPENIIRINMLNENMQMKLVKLDIEYVKYIDNIHVNVQNYVINKCVHLVKHMNTISEKLQFEILKHDPHLVMYFNNPSQSIIDFANNLKNLENCSIYFNK